MAETKYCGNCKTFTPVIGDVCTVCSGNAPKQTIPFSAAPTPAKRRKGDGSVVLLKILSIASVPGVFVLAALSNAQGGVAFVLCIAAAVNAVILWAFANLIDALLDIEFNTRKT